MNTTTAIKGRTYTVETLDETNGTGQNVLKLTGSRGARYNLYPVPNKPSRYVIVAMTRHVPFNVVERDGDNFKVIW